MEVRQLRYFVAAAELRNIARAAEKLNVSQPPVSRQIKALEDELGLSLFERTTKGVALTTAGDRFLKDARRILSDMEAAQRAAQSAARGEIGTLNVAFFGSTIYFAVPIALHALKEAQPDVEVKLQRAEKAVQLDWLRRGSIDIGFGRYYDPDPEMVVETLAREPLYIAVSVREAVEVAAEFPLPRVAERPLILFPAAGRPNFADHVVTALTETGHGPQVADVAEDATAALALVAHGDSRCVVPATVATLRFPGIRFFPIKDCPATVPVNCVYRRMAPSPVMGVFLTVLRSLDFETKWYTVPE